jgi:hypothetical protein
MLRADWERSRAALLGRLLRAIGSAGGRVSMAERLRQDVERRQLGAAGGTSRSDGQDIERGRQIGAAGGPASFLKVRTAGSGRARGRLNPPAMAKRGRQPYGS